MSAPAIAPTATILATELERLRDCWLIACSAGEFVGFGAAAVVENGRIDPFLRNGDLAGC